ncbi:MAG TPA: hypothetical protein EYP65_01970 [Armatimonadetes bacterium]|nr:hypothetical protein [Armatimonadota bacterium]
MAIRWRAIFLAFVAAALGCARTIDDREGVERKYGPPEEESTYYVGDEAYSIWWYWSIGRAFGFRYKKAKATCGGEEGWDRSFTFTFQPVATPEEKRVVIEQLKLFLALTEFMVHASYRTANIYFDTSPTQAQRVNQAMAISPIYANVAKIARTRIIDK